MNINCVVCGEPWDSYGVRHGDMAKWEAECFLKGAGCPSCEGETPEGVDASEVAYESAKAEVFCPGDDTGDVAEAFIAIAEGAERPKWERPEDEIVFSCAGCDARLRRNRDDENLYWTGQGPRKFYRHDWGTEDFEGFEIGEEKFCPGCAGHCSECVANVFFSNTSITGTVLYGDTYDPGASFEHPQDWGKTVCYSCYENSCTEESA